jgi:uncharacterized protein DUF6894
MTHYFFHAQYRGARATDDIGEAFPTVGEAEAHAAVVAHELGRNESQPVTVYVYTEDGKLIATKAAPTGWSA